MKRGTFFTLLFCVAVLAAVLAKVAYAALPSGYQVAIGTWFDFSGGNGGATIYSPDGVSLVMNLGKDGGLTVNGTETTSGTINNGFAIPQCLHGGDAGTASVLTVAFAPNFTAVPDCTCSTQVASGYIGCQITSRAVTGAVFNNFDGGTDVIEWNCCN